MTKRHLKRLGETNARGVFIGGTPGIDYWETVVLVKALRHS
jgi:hypothetical protein